MRAPCARPGVPVTSVRYNGTIHDFVMLHALRDTRAAKAATAQGTAHVYVAPDTVATFVSSWEATFGGTNTTAKVTDVTPAPSETISELMLSPVGTLSVFGYTTPAPYPFGQERGGDLVASFGAGVADAVRSGAELVVSPWNDPIGKDAIVQFPGGVDQQIYWHTTGYAVDSLTATLARATAAGARVLWEPHRSATADTATVQFPGGYIAEVHQMGSAS